MKRIRLSSKQMEAYRLLTDKKTRSIGYGGGARGGKTWLGCIWIYSMAMNYPGTTWFLGRKTLVDLKRTTLEEFFKIQKEFFGNYASMFGDSEIRFLNGSKIRLLDLAYQPSSPHTSSLDGLVLQGGLIDEANEIHPKVISTLYTRIMADNRYPDLYPKILETFNPDKGRVYDYFYKPYKLGEEKPGVRFIPALAKDNPYCPKGYIEAILSSGDEMAIQRKIYGNFEYDDDPDALCSYADISMCYNKQVKDVQNGIKYLSVDIAASGRDKTVMVVWDGLAVIEVLKEDITTHDSLIKNIDMLMNKHKITGTNVIMDSSGVGALIPSRFAGSIAFAGNAKPFKFGFDNLRSECYYTLAQYISSGQVSLAGIGNSKDVVFRELASIRRDRKDTEKIKILSKDAVKTYLGNSPDYADAIMMRMYFEKIPKNIFITY